MSDSPATRTRALSRALAKHWRRVVAEPRLLPDVIGKAWRVLRGGRLDALVERNVLRDDWFSDYAAWLAAYEAADGAELSRLAAQVRAIAAPPRVALIVVASEHAPPRALAATLASIDAQPLMLNACAVLSSCDGADVVRGRPRTTLTHFDAMSGPWSALGAAVARVEAEWVGIVDAGDTLAPDAIAQFTLELTGAPDVVLAYSDHDELDADGVRVAPDFKPSWDPYLFAQQQYIGKLWLARRSALADALADPAPLSEWDLLWRIAEAAPRGVAHLPRVLCHRAYAPPARTTPARPPHGHFERTATTVAFERRGPGSWMLRFPLPSPAPRVSVVIPTRDQPALLAAATESVLAATRYPDVELIVVDNGSVDAAALALLARLAARPRVRVIRDPGPFNFARLNNAAAREASGALLCFLNDDTRVIAADWLDELVSLALRDDVGVVGARLLYADATIQHSGVVLGAFALTHHLLQGRPADFRGYHDRGLLTHAVSCVTAACAVVRRDLFDALGGFDENLPSAYNDVDLCLAALARGRYNLVVNRPLLHHFESATRGYYYTSEQESADRAALDYLISKWGDGIRADPFYNPNLALDRENYTLAYPPRVPRERALRIGVGARRAPSR